MTKNTIILTMGDPAGVGPEVLLKSYKKAKETQNLVAISDFSKIQYLAKRHDVPLKKINYVDEASDFKDYLKIERGLSENSIYSYENDLKKLKLFLNKNIKQISPLDVEADHIKEFVYFISK